MNEAQIHMDELWIDVQLEGANDNTPLEERYPSAVAYHQKNPQVYDLIKKYTFEVISAGYTRYSMYTVINRVRWHAMIETIGDQFKVNNNHSPFYARLFMEEFPEYGRFFETRAYPKGVRRG